MGRTLGSFEQLVLLAILRLGEGAYGVTIRQEMPHWIRGPIPLPGPGTVEIIISKTGVIERATIVQSMVNFYDRQILDATKNWRYQPAQLDGQPVRFRKQIRITFQ